MNDSVSKKIGSVIKEQREYLGFSREEMALLLGDNKTQNYVKSLEEGLVKISLEELRQICTILSIQENKIRKIFLDDFQLQFSNEILHTNKKIKATS